MGVSGVTRRRIFSGSILVAFLVFSASLFHQGIPAGTADLTSTQADSLGSGQARRNAIIESYQIAFGRAPAQDELAYWMSVPGNDPRVSSLTALVNNHREWLKYNAGERQATMQRAFRAVFKQGASQGQQAWYNDLLRDQARTGATYRDLTRHLAGSMVDAAYSRLLQRAPDSGGREHHINLMLNSGWNAEQIWTGIAQSQERVDRFGYWAPAAVSYSGKRESCFGAIGNKCDGAPRSNPVWVDKFTRPDGVEMGYVEIQVSVGSILHDNACVRNGAGNMCNGLLKGLTLDQLPLAAYLQPASLEWNKAVYNTYDGRFWTERFGPYPTNNNLRAQFSDDLTKVSNRSSKMAPIVAAGLSGSGLGAWPVPTIDYRLGETRQTRALKAPAGTAVDRGDQSFCRSGSYREEGNGWIAKWWGICK